MRYLFPQLRRCRNRPVPNASGTTASQQPVDPTSSFRRRSYTGLAANCAVQRMEGSFQRQLINVLNKTRRREAKGPEDKVYSLYGVLTSLGLDMHIPKEKVPFEYAYLDFTKRIINWQESLGILLEAGVPPAAGGSPLRNTPSWVPDWRWPLDRISLQTCVAAKDSSPHFSLSNSELEIHTKGIFVDALNSITSIPVNLTDLLENESTDILATCMMYGTSAFAGWIRDVVQLQRLAAGPSPEDAIFEVLHSNTDPNLYNSEQLRDAFRRWHQMVTADWSALDVTYPMDWQIAVNVANDDVVYPYHRRLLKSMTGRKLLITKQGCIGAGPWDMRTGDVVALIAGFGLPMILRENGEQGYLVVGAAHIHGLMKGEAWPSEMGDLEEIVLL